VGSIRLVFSSRINATVSQSFTLRREQCHIQEARLHSIQLHVSWIEALFEVIIIENAPRISVRQGSGRAGCHAVPICCNDQDAGLDVIRLVDEAGISLASMDDGGWQGAWRSPTSKGILVGT
jgi:hypothetical protein